MTDRTSDEHLRVVTTFQKAPSKLDAALPALTHLWRDAAAWAEERRLVREIASGSALSESSPPGG
jgi:hypothetical protein